MIDLRGGGAAPDDVVLLLIEATAGGICGAVEGK